MVWQYQILKAELLQMTLTRASQTSAGHPELHTYKCTLCKSLMTIPVQRRDH